MTKIYSKLDGEILAIRRNSEVEFIDGYSHVLEFDEETNPTILENYARDHNGHSLIGNALIQNGVPYTINPDSSVTSDKKQLVALRQELVDYYKNPSPTNAQSIRAIKVIIRVLGVVFDWYLKRKLNLE